MCGEFVDQAGTVVGVEVGEDLADAVRVQGADQFGLQGRVERLEDLQGRALGQ